MKEELLQFLWQYKCFPHELCTTDGKIFSIENVGILNRDEGPDFFMAEIIMDHLRWKGSVEIHLKSSDWLLHKHSQNAHYNNLILHVVYEYDKEIDFLMQHKIPTLELKHLVDKEIIEKYQHLVKNGNKIACSEYISQIKDPSTFSIYYEKWFIEKIQKSIETIEMQYKTLGNHWEAVLFHRLAYALGLKVNADIFRMIAENIPFKTILQNCENEENLLALFLGKAALLDNPKDEFHLKLKEKYTYIKHKFALNEQTFAVKFSRMRPANFPTLKLAILANIYAQYKNVFASFILENQTKTIYKLLEECKPHAYFETHYQMGVEGAKGKRKLSRKAIDLIMLNAILPIQWAYRKSLQENTETLIEAYENISPENNQIIDNFSKLKFPICNAKDTQALIHLHNKYCIEKKCLHCNIGLQILKK